MRDKLWGHGMEGECMIRLKQVVLDFFKADAVKVFLFGSRGRKDNHASSDVDIGILPLGDFAAEKLTLLREKIEALNIPYKVEIVNFLEVSEEFRREALKEAVVWKD